MSNAANANASAAPKKFELVEGDQVQILFGREVDQGHGMRTIEQQCDALALPRRHVGIGEAELPLKPVVPANPQFTMDIGPNGAVPVHAGTGHLFGMIGGDHVTAEDG